MKIQNKLIAEVCRNSINRLIKESEEFQGNKFSKEKLLQCFLKAIQNEDFESEESNVRKNTIYINANTDNSCELSAWYYDDEYELDFEFTIWYDAHIVIEPICGDGWETPVTGGYAYLDIVENFNMSSIKVSNETDAVIEVNDEIIKKVFSMLNFELDDDYAERRYHDYYDRWE